MMTFTNETEARKYVREMSPEATEVMGDCAVWVDMATGELYIVEPGDDLDALPDEAVDAGTVRTDLY